MTAIRLQKRPAFDVSAPDEDSANWHLTIEDRGAPQDERGYAQVIGTPAEIRQFVYDLMRYTTARFPEVPALLKLPESPSAPGRSTLETVGDVAAAILATSPGPLHYQDLYRLAAMRGLKLSGRKPERNFSNYLSHNLAFQSVGRGMWDLAERVRARQEPSQRPLEVASNGQHAPELESEEAAEWAV